jgi:RNA polymerase sigma-70 factor (ECF subfamily)
VYHYEKAKDVVNDGYVKLFLGINKFKYENDSAVEKLLMGWIRRIMINTAIDELRKNNMLPEIGGIPEYVWEETNSDLNADQRLLYKEMIAYVKTLPPVYRIVFNMFVIDGYSHQEIAHVLGISVGTSKSNLFKARNLLQKLINNDELENIYAANR